MKRKHIVRMRSWMDQYGSLGILLVGCILGLHHLRTKRRLALLGSVMAVAAALTWLLLHPHPETLHRIATFSPSFPLTFAAPKPAPIGPPAMEFTDQEPVGFNGLLFFSAQFYRMSGE